MASEWKPDPGVNLHGSSEANPISVLIYYDVPTATPPDPQDPMPVSYAAWWTSTPTPTYVTLTPSSSGITVAGPNVTGMAAVQVDYMLNGVSHHLVGWDGMPAANKAQKIYKYQAPGSNTVTATFMAQVTLEGGSILTQSYTIQATIDYSSGKDRLVLEVNLRR